MKPLSIGILVAAVFAVALFATGPAGAQSTKPVPTAVSQEYKLVIGDTIQVVVQGHSTLDQQYLVPANGEVSFPPVGKVTLLGKTTTEVEKELEKRLVDEGQLVEPSVFVLLVAYAPRKAFLIGAVNRDIDLPVHEDYTIVKVLSMAGASPSLADYKRVKIIRKKRDGSSFSILVDVGDILFKDEYHKDLKIMPGDVIYVPPIRNLSEQAYVYVLGKVNNPGKYAYDPTREKMTLLKVIAGAGDFNQFARTSSIKVLRRDGSRTSIIEVDFSDIIDGDIQDVALEPNDTIFVPESPI